MRSVRKIWGTSQPKSWNTHEKNIKISPIYAPKVSPRIGPGYFSQKSHWGAIALISGVLLCVIYAGLSAGHLVPRPQELLRNTEETLWANNPGAVWTCVWGIWLGKKLEILDIVWLEQFLGFFGDCHGIVMGYILLLYVYIILCIIKYIKINMVVSNPGFFPQIIPFQNGFSSRNTIQIAEGPVSSPVLVWPVTRKGW